MKPNGYVTPHSFGTMHAEPKRKKILEFIIFCAHGNAENKGNQLNWLNQAWVLSSCERARDPGNPWDNLGALAFQQHFGDSCSVWTSVRACVRFPYLTTKKAMMKLARMLLGPFRIGGPEKMVNRSKKVVKNK